MKGRNAVFKAASGFLLICFGFPEGAAGQFFGLATPADGSTVYFSTPLAQRSTAQPIYGKIFRVDASGLKLAFSREIQTPAPPTGPILLCLTTNAYELLAADVSSAGDVLAITAKRRCAYSWASKTPELSVTTIIAGAGETDYAGSLRLSPNGVWAFGAGLYSAYVVNVPEKRQDQAPEARSVGGILEMTLPSAGRPIANDGTAVYPGRLSGLTVLKGGKARSLSAVGYPDEAIIDASARFVVYTACTNRPITVDGAQGIEVDCSDRGLFLRRADIDGGRDTLVAVGGYAPSLSDDGRRLLYLSRQTGAAQAYVMDIENSATRPITADTDGISRAVLSGDGHTAYAVNRGGRLLKISIDSAAVQEVLPRTPYLGGGQAAGLGTVQNPYVSPGKLVTIPGAGLTDSAVSAAPPLPQTLAGVRLTVNGQPALIQRVEPGAITALMPAGLLPGAAVIELETDSPSPFASPTFSTVAIASLPEFLPASTSAEAYIWAAHTNWDGVVSEESPAQPGEIVHAYAMGLGATEPAVAPGEAAPDTEPLARLSPPLLCSCPDTGEAVEVLFAGLAPRMAGIYQVDLRIPVDARDGYFVLWCARGRTPLFGNIEMTGALPVAHPTSRAASPR